MKRRLIILTVICIFFILLQSLIPENTSAHESQWFVTHIVDPVLNWFGVRADKDLIRKIAHVFEFCICSFILFLWRKRPVDTFYAGFTLAFLDESLQVITGRGALVTDIWIDLLGVASGTVIGILCSNYRKEMNK